MNIGVIFAGGVGSRMHSKDRPKQFLEMYNKPIIVHTLEYFENHPMIDAIVVVCIKDWIPYLEKLLYKFRIDKVKKIVPGGETGQLSIYNGLRAAKEIAGEEKSIVLIHDGVRPLISEKLITNNIETVMKHGSAITTAKVKETILVVNEGKSSIDYVPSRNNSRVAKAPQSFWLDDILKAHEKSLEEGETNCIDSCTMMQKYGYDLYLIDGPSQNIKITTPEDFYTMRAILEDLKYIANYSLPYEEMKGTTVLVTGATGLIGVSIVRALVAIGDIKVIAHVRNREKAEEIYGALLQKNVELYVDDITKEINVSENIDYIFHCASITTSKTMIEKPVETICTSVEGTKNILELAKNKKSKSVIYVSSMEMYGAFNNLNHDVTEKDLGYVDNLKIRSNYPESKRLCENMCIAYMSEYNIPVKIARLAQTFGAGILPGENRVFAQFAKSAIKGEDIVLHTKGISEGNYCYTRDCITGLLTILLKGKNGEAYNVSNPESHITIADMAYMVADKIAEGRIKVVFDIPSENKFGYAADTKMKLNSSKLQALGWKPEIGLEEAYKRMILDMEK